MQHNNANSDVYKETTKKNFPGLNEGCFFEIQQK